MGRPAHADPPHDIRVSMPGSLIARLDLLLWDPIRSRPIYGARSKLINHLVTKWVEDQEALRSNPQGVPDGQSVTADSAQRGLTSGSDVFDEA